VCVPRKRRAHWLSAASAIVSLLFAFFSYVDHTTAAPDDASAPPPHPLTLPTPPRQPTWCARSLISCHSPPSVEWSESHCADRRCRSRATYTHIHTRVRAHHTVVRENPTPAAAIVNRWNTGRCFFVAFVVSLKKFYARVRAWTDRRPTRCRSFYRRKIFDFQILIVARARICPSLLSRPRAPPCVCVRNNLVAFVVFLLTAAKV